jgi:hypothetical protein
VTGVVIVVEGDADLLEMVDTLEPVGCVADSLNGGQQQGDQRADDGDHDQKLDEGKALSSSAAFTSEHGDPPSAGAADRRAVADSRLDDNAFVRILRSAAAHSTFAAVGEQRQDFTPESRKSKNCGLALSPAGCIGGRAPCCGRTLSRPVAACLFKGAGDVAKPSCRYGKQQYRAEFWEYCEHSG